MDAEVLREVGTWLLSEAARKDSTAQGIHIPSLMDCLDSAFSEAGEGILMYRYDNLTFIRSLKEIKEMILDEVQAWNEYVELYNTR